MLSFCNLILSTFVICALTIPPGNGQIIPGFPRPITLPGMSIRGLTYDSNTFVILFSDADGKTINRYNPTTLTLQTLQLDQSPSFVIPIKGQQYAFLVGLARDLVVLWWNYDAPLLEAIPQTTYFTCLLTKVDAPCQSITWNSGTVDAYGNLWGTTANHQDSSSAGCLPGLYRGLTTRAGLLTADTAVKSFRCSGVVFTQDYNIMYTTDHDTRQVYSFRYDLTTALICHPEVVFKYDHYDLPGFPGSMDIDADGNLWIGSFKGGEVIYINPNTGELLGRQPIPVSQITGVFIGGGGDQTVLFVATQVPEDGDASLEPLAGSLFAIGNLDIRGFAAKPAVVNNFCKPFYL